MAEAGRAGSVSKEAHLDLAEGIRSVRSGDLDAKLHQGVDANSEYAAQGALSGNVAFRNAQPNGGALDLAALVGRDVDLANIALISGGAGPALSFPQNFVSDFQIGTRVALTAASLPNIGAADSSANEPQFFAFGGGLGKNDGGDLPHEANASLAAVALQFEATRSIGPQAGDRGADAPTGTDSPSGSGDKGGDPGTPVPVDGVAVAPGLFVRDAAGFEDTVIPISINAWLNDTDGSETLTITLSGLPAGALLSAGQQNADGSWTLAPSDLVGLTLTPASGFTGSVQLLVSAVSAEAGTTATTTGAIAIDVMGIAKAPNLTVSSASGVEDIAIPLVIATSLTNNDGSETLTLSFDTMPPGTLLSAGRPNVDGSWTLTPADLANLSLTPPPGFSGAIHIDIVATASENGTFASTSRVLDVIVSGVATTPNLSVSAASGEEDQPIALGINASLADSDGSETLSLTISGIPAGAILSHGTLNPDGSWTLAEAELAGLTLIPPAGFSGSIPLTVTATSAENGTTAAVTRTLGVTVAPVASPPNLTVTAAAGPEGAPIALDISASVGSSSDTLSVTIAGVPAGATLSAGHPNADGSWTLAPNDLAGLTMTPSPGFSGTLALIVTAIAFDHGAISSVDQLLSVSVTPVATTPNLTVSAGAGAEDTAVALTINASLNDTDGSEALSLTVTGIPAGGILSCGTLNVDGSWTLAPGDLAGLTLTPPPGFSGTLHLDVTATSSEAGTTASVHQPLDVTVTGVASLPNLSVAAAAGLEDAAIPLSINASLRDTDGSETLEITITGVPAGSVLSHGSLNPDGSWTVAPGDLAGLTLTPPSGFSGSLHLEVTATASENGTTASVHQGLDVDILGVASTPNLAASSSSGAEDTPIALAIAASSSDPDGSETVLLTITGVPAGATLSHGSLNADGSWSLTPGDLAGLTLTPPPGFSGTINLGIDAIAAENGTTASAHQAFDVTVTPVASPPSLTVAAASGTENTAIAVTINAALTDTDGSETLSITVAGMPAGAVLNHGTLNPDGSWTLAPGDLAGLTITPAAGYSGVLHLNVTATSAESGLTASTSQLLDVTVTSVATPPTLIVSGSMGAEDTAIPISIAVASTDPDGSETVSLTVTGLPSGAVLSAGHLNADGSWTLSTTDLMGLTLTPPLGFSGALVINVEATSSEGASSASTDDAFVVVVSGVASTPNLSVSAANGFEDSAIPLSIAASLSDTDGSETLSLLVTGVPAGATLSHGVQNPDGSWTLAPTDLAGLTLTPPHGYSGNIILDVAATSGENGTTSTVHQALGITVTGVASTPNLTVAGATGTENTAIALVISASLSDTDGSESLSLSVTGVPAGAVLNHGTQNPDGSWTLAPGDLAGLTFTPPNGFSGTIQLGVTATSSENGTTASIDHQLAITVAGVASVPSLLAANASGLEATPIALSIAASLNDGDGSETLSLDITGVPAGASLSAGHVNPDGSWTLAPTDLPGLMLTPAPGYSGTLHLGVTATSSENGTTASVNQAFDVTVAGVATPPTLTVGTASGLEGAPIALSIVAGLVDNDGSETLGITITGVPAGAILNHGTRNPDGSWALSPSDLSNLNITPPGGYSGTLQLGVTATSRENGTTASVSEALDIVVAGVASMPNLTVAAAAGSEATPIPLSINASLSDSDGSETLALSITGVPAGAVLNHGMRNADGSWTLTPGDLAGLTITPAAGFSGTLHLDVTATSSENGTTASISHGLDVAVAGVATPPNLAVSSVSGPEDTAIPLTIAASLNDIDGSETLSVTIAGAPAGSVLSHGILNADGSWTLAPGDLAGLTITPPLAFNGTIALDVTATSAENATTASVHQALKVQVSAVAGTPMLSVGAAAGAEDSAIGLTISAVIANPSGNEVVDLTITGMPVGATLNHGTQNPDGSWSLTPADLTGLSLTPPPNYSGSFQLGVTATSNENGTSASASNTLAVTVTGVADAPNLTVTPASGLEGAAIPLGITASLNDTDGSEALGLTITGLPAGSVLSHGTHNANGSWTLTPADLSGLTLTPPPGYSGTLHLGVTATAGEDGTTSSVTQVLNVAIAGVASLPNLSVGAAAGDEGTPIPLGITATLSDNDGSETLALTVTGVPAGAVLNHGTRNADGSWTLMPGDLAGLTITPPDGYSGTLHLGVTATAAENGATNSVSASLDVAVAGVASLPTLSVVPASGSEGAPIVLTIAAGLSDTDGSETLSITISGIPAGAVLNHGWQNPNGSWTLTPGDLVGLTLTPPLGYSGILHLGVTATSSENGSTSWVSEPLDVSVSGVASPPNLSVGAAAGNEGTPIPLAISASLSDADGSETLALTISGVPIAATLNHGTLNPNGNWTLAPGDLTNLTITPAAGFSGTLHLAVTATSSENGTTNAVSAPLDVVVAGVASPPNLAVSAASGNEGASIPLSITAGLSDTDGSETLALKLTGVPSSAVLNHGTRNPDGSWTLGPSDLTGLAITPAAGYSGTLHLNVTATSSENGTTASVSQILDVSVAGIASPPTLNVSAASGSENAAIPLSINASLSDADGSETLALTVAGLPAGAVLNHGTLNPNGTWTLAPADLSGLTLTAAPGYSGTLHLSVTATSSENGTTSSVHQALDVTVAGVASTPTLSLTAATGNEATAIPLTISAALTDTDGSETLSIAIVGVPGGATLNHGNRNPDGSWTLAPGDLTGLTLTPAPGYSGTLHLGVTATSAENGTTAAVNGNLDVTVIGTATTPSLSVSSATGAEDSAIALSISAALVDTDGSETLGVKITGVPNGASLSAGTQNPDGSYSLTAAQLSGLKITPPANYSGVIHLDVTATSNENGTTASISQGLDVTVTGIADTPNLMVMGTAGTENTAIPLIISASSPDSDGSESVSVTITGLPAGASLNHGTRNADGSWTVPAAGLTGLTLTPPANYAGTMQLGVVAGTSEAGTTASSGSKSLEVAVYGVANVPNLTVNAASGSEDSAIALGIASSVTDPRETLSLTISNVPAGAMLSAGSYIGNGTWSLTPSQLSGLTITPPSQFSGAMNMTVTAISTEPTGDYETKSTPLNVTVIPVADAPNLLVGPASGNEDTAISLNISANPADNSETLSIKITGMPAGASLSAGTLNGDGSWTLTQTQLTNLKVTPPANSDTDFTLTVAATSTESNGATATTTVALPVVVHAVADMPTVSAGNATGSAGVAIPLAISGGSPDPSETVSFVVSGVPDGFALNKGTNNGDNTWTLSSADLSGLTLMSPSRLDAQLKLNVTAVSHDNENMSRTSTAVPFTVNIGNYATGYLIDLTAAVQVGGIGAGVHVGVLPDIDLFPSSGGLLQTNGLYIKEDTWTQISDSTGLLALPVLSGLLAAVNYITLSGIPTGTQFSAGTNFGGGIWGFTSAQLNNLQMKAPSNYSGDFTVVATANMLLGILPITLTSTTIHVQGVADAPTLAVTAGSATEDQAFALNITGALTDSSETLSYLVSGLPAGFSLNHGIYNGNGSWSLTAADVAGLTVAPTADYAGHVDIKVSAISTEQQGDSVVVQQTVGVNISAAADNPVVSPTAATTTEDHAIGLNLGVGLKDADGSESISNITISGLPTGATLTGATDNHNGTWSVNPANASGVQFVPGSHWSGDANLTVTAQSTESSNGSTATNSGTLKVHVDSVADAPSLMVSDSSGDLGAPIGLHIAASLSDTDGSERLAVVISGLPDGFTISNGQNDGHGDWTLDASDLAHATITAPAGVTGDFNLTVTAVATEQSNGGTAESHANITVHVSDYDHAFQSH